MIKVYIWSFQGKRDAWGHASMQVGTNYISWWPMGTGRVHSKFYDDVFSAHARQPSFQDNIDGEGGQPNRTILINGLDEAWIISWWHRVFPWAASRLGPPSIPWRSLGWNCSKVVATGLKEGGGDRFASWSKPWALIAWTPNGVHDYAESIVRGMASR